MPAVKVLYMGKQEVEELSGTLAHGLLRSYQSRVTGGPSCQEEEGWIYAQKGQEEIKVLHSDLHLASFVEHNQILWTG